MKTPFETKPFLYGLAAGAIVLVVVGFSWGGWIAGGNVETFATQRANAAVVAALEPVCMESFKDAPDAVANLTARRKADALSKDEFGEKGGWADVPGTIPPEQLSAVARACALLLAPA